MTITNLYAKYLLADRLNKIAKDAGITVNAVEFHNGDQWGDADLEINAYGVIKRFDGEGSNHAEIVAIRLMDAMPELALERKSGLIFLNGKTKTGLTFRFYTGSGSCELVQVGTRTLPAEDAKPEREEPIFEKRCVDDLAGLVTS
jgi:hypothetical protein